MLTLMWRWKLAQASALRPIATLGHGGSSFQTPFRWLQVPAVIVSFVSLVLAFRDRGVTTRL